MKKENKQVEELFSELEEQVFTKGKWNPELKDRIFELTEVKKAFEEHGEANTDSHSRITKLGAVWSAIDSGNKSFAETYARGYITIYETAKQYAELFRGKKC